MSYCQCEKNASLDNRKAGECPVDRDVMRVMDGRWKGYDLWRLQEGRDAPAKITRFHYRDHRAHADPASSETCADGSQKKDDKKTIPPWCTIHSSLMEGRFGPVRPNDVQWGRAHFEASVRQDDKKAHATCTEPYQ